MKCFASVVRMKTIRLLISSATQMDWRIFQLNVKSTFLNGYLEENEKILKLKKVLYGLKQAPRAWNSRIDKYFQDNEFVRCQHEYRVMSYYLGLEVKQMNNDIFVSQESYAKKVLKKFKIFDCNPVNTLVEGSLKLSKFDGGEKEDPTFLRYLPSTRAHIIYVVGVVCCFMEFHTSTYIKAAKGILHYLKGTLDFGLFYSFSNEFKLKRFCDICDYNFLHLSSYLAKKIIEGI
ncbi:hypothetical protein CR513_45296, partial [Mucuna pruriens]